MYLTHLNNSCSLPYLTSYVLQKGPNSELLQNYYYNWSEENVDMISKFNWEIFKLPWFDQLIISLEKSDHSVCPCWTTKTHIPLSYNGVTEWCVSLTNNTCLNTNTCCRELINQRTAKVFILAISELTLISYSWSDLMADILNSDFTSQVKKRNLLPCFPLLFSGNEEWEWYI